MRVTKNIHTLEIPFHIKIAPEKQISRSVYVSLVFGKEITLIDSGVSGAHLPIFTYIKDAGREPRQITTLILSHSHPDHIGSARSIHELTGCAILASRLEKGWIEDTAKQKLERPVPGFDSLVDGPVNVDGLLEEKQILQLDDEVHCRVLSTPGHSRGSLSLLFAKEKLLFTGDALPPPGDLPIYEDIATSLQSIRKLKDLATQVNTILSSWEPPIRGQEKITKRIEASLFYLKKIHDAVVRIHARHNEKGMPLCQKVVAELGLPPFAVNPLVARAFMSSLLVAGQKDLFEKYNFDRD